MAAKGIAGKRKAVLLQFQTILHQDAAVAVRLSAAPQSCVIAQHCPDYVLPGRRISLRTKNQLQKRGRTTSFTDLPTRLC